jgi:hypothetical protein
VVDSQLNFVDFSHGSTSCWFKGLVLYYAIQHNQGCLGRFVGNESMIRNKYNALRSQDEEFMKLPDVNHQEM